MVANTRHVERYPMARGMILAEFKKEHCDTAKEDGSYEPHGITSEMVLENDELMTRIQHCFSSGPGHLPKVQSMYVKVRVLVSSSEVWELVLQLFESVTNGEIVGCNQCIKYTKWVQAQYQKSRNTKRRVRTLTKPKVPDIEVGTFEALWTAMSEEPRKEILQKLSDGEYSYKDAKEETAKFKAIARSFEWACLVTDCVDIEQVSH
jgi:hypothetical protein